MSNLKNSLAGLSKRKRLLAKVIDVYGTRASVRIGENGTGQALNNLSVVGGPVVVDDIVFIDYSSGSPVIHARGAEATAVADDGPVQRPRSQTDPDIDEGDTSGEGDMLKEVYDTDDDGIVDEAESVPWDGITDKPTFVEDFLDLGDVIPASYTGHGGKSVIVHASETGLDFQELAAAFTDLTDVPSSYTGQASKVVKVNATETGLVFATESGGSGGEGSYDRFDMDAHPSSPMEWDDEFDGAISNNWETWYCAGDTALGYLVVQGPASPAGFQGLFQDLSFHVAHKRTLMVGKFSLVWEDEGEDSPQMGIFFGDDLGTDPDTTDFYALTVERASSDNMVISCGLYDNRTDASPTIDASRTINAQEQVYLAIATWVTDTYDITLHYYWSIDGIAWYLLYTETVVSWPTGGDYPVVGGVCFKGGDDTAGYCNFFRWKWKTNDEAISISELGRWVNTGPTDKTFLDLADTPDDFTSMGGKLVAVDMAETGLEFIDAPTGSGDMTKAVYDLDDNGVVDEAEAVPWTGVTDKPSTFPPDSHTHDDRYYTETELNTTGGQVHWDVLTNKPSTFAPSAHHTSHESAGGDAIKLDDLAAPDDNTDLNASTDKHGLLPKLGGGTTNFLRADGTWAEPPGGGSIANHDHSGDAGDGGTFDAANLTSGSATDGHVLTADGSGGAAWEAPSGGADNDAIHDNVSGEISAITEKTTPVGNDILLIEDSQASNAKKKLLISNLPGSSAYSRWDVLAPPSSAHDCDDEFSDSSFDTGLWTEWDHGAVQTVSEDSFGLCLSMAHQSSNISAGIWQAIPEGDFTMWGDIVANLHTYDGWFGGLALFENPTDSTKKIVFWGFESGYGGIVVKGHYWNSYNSGASSQICSLELGNIKLAHLHFRIQRVSSNYRFGWSTDGYGYGFNYNSTLTITPTAIGYLYMNRSNGTSNLRSDYFRVTASGAADQILAGRVISF